MTMRVSCTDTEIRCFKDFGGHEFDLLGSRDVIGHVTIGLGTCGFLLVVHWNQASILHRYGDMGCHGQLSDYYWATSLAAVVVRVEPCQQRTG